jgi:endonuclease/exonuclease/phosphatase family metal-dependent hydrolase
MMRNRLSQMAQFLRELNADVIALQEVHQNPRFGFQANQLAEVLEYDMVFAPAIPLAGGSYGNALLSRWNIQSHEVVPLAARGEQRCLLRAVLCWGGEPIQVWNTHLSLDKKSRASQLAWMQVEAMAQLRKGNRLIIAGDLNTSSSPFAFLLDCAREQKCETKSTLVLYRKRVDYLFVTPHWNISEYQVLRVIWSDHYPIMATLTQVSQPVELSK